MEKVSLQSKINTLNAIDSFWGFPRVLGLSDIILETRIEVLNHIKLKKLNNSLKRIYIDFCMSDPNQLVLKLKEVLVSKEILPE